MLPVRANMTAQRPGQGLAATGHDGYRSYIFYPTASSEQWDYTSQQVVDNDIPGCRGDIIVGGAGIITLGYLLGTAGSTDDSLVDFHTTATLSGVLPQYFGSRWGAESAPTEAEDEEYSAGRIKSAWCGIVSISGDRVPWVGKLPAKISGRKVVGGGEYISGSYSGEGMTHAWLCAKALAQMMLDKNGAPPGFLPKCFLVDERRWKRAKLEDLL